MIILALLMFFSTVPASAETTYEWQLPLRDAVFAMDLDANQIMPLYEKAITAAKENLTGPELYLAHSRCNLLIGQALINEGRNKEARPFFTEGLELAKKANKEQESSAAWILSSEHISRLCQIGTVGFAIGNGLDVEKWARKALALDPRNALAQYMLASRWVYGPGILGNPKKGIEMMLAIFDNADMDITNYFDVNSAIGYGYLQLKKPAEARPWLLKAMEYYPTNKFVAGLLAKTEPTGEKKTK